MVEAGRYHAFVGWPDWTRTEALLGRLRLDATEHALDRVESDETGELRVPNAISITPEMYARDPADVTGGDRTLPHVVDIRVEPAPDGSRYEARVVRAAVRWGFDGNHDQTVVVSRQGTVITTWTNERDDHRQDADYGRYVEPD